MFRPYIDYVNIISTSTDSSSTLGNIITTQSEIYIPFFDFLLVAISLSFAVLIGCVFYHYAYKYKK